MRLTNYVAAMDCWKGRVDSTTDYDAFRWHQWVQPLDLNEVTEIENGKLGFAFIGFCSEQGVKRNKGRIGTAPCTGFYPDTNVKFPLYIFPGSKVLRCRKHSL